MQIYLIDYEKEKAKWMERYFDDCDNVTVIHTDFVNFMNSHPDVECIVSPANSFGLMDGGYDAAITAYFGRSLQEKVQQYIIDHYHGEQPIGTSCLVNIDSGRNLIHTPTMQYPSHILDPRVIYQCMRTTLLEAIKHDIESIVIPMFGGTCGGVEPEMAAALMRSGYDQIFSEAPTQLNWEYAFKTYLDLNLCNQRKLKDVINND